MTWFAIAACLVVSFTFSGIEAGLLSLNRIRLRHYADKKNKAAVLLQGLLQHPGRLLAAVLVVTNLMNILALVLAVAQADRMFGNYGYLLVFAVALPVILFLVELLPKALFRRFPYRALAFFSTPLRIAYLILAPVFAIGAVFVRWFVPADSETGKRQIFLAREEFKDLTAESERAGALSEVERKMIHNVVDFRAVKAKDVMIPLADVVAVRQDTPIQQLIDLAVQKDIDRLPVLDAEGRVVGLVNIFDVLWDRKPTATAYNYLRRIVTAGPEEAAYGLIRRLRAARMSLASVVDAKGETLGIVSSEAMVDRLVRSALS